MFIDWLTELFKALSIDKSDALAPGVYLNLALATLVLFIRAVAFTHVALEAGPNGLSASFVNELKDSSGFSYKDVAELANKSEDYLNTNEVDMQVAFPYVLNDRFFWMRIFRCSTSLCGICLCVRSICDDDFLLSSSFGDPKQRKFRAIKGTETAGCCLLGMCGAGRNAQMHLKRATYPAPTTHGDDLPWELLCTVSKPKPSIVPRMCSLGTYETYGRGAEEIVPAYNLWVRSAVPTCVRQLTRATTFLMGFPISGAIVPLFANAALLENAMIVRLGNLVALLQLLMQDLLDFIVDTFMIVKASEEDEVLWFQISFLWSVMCFLCVVVTFVRSTMQEDGTIATPPVQKDEPTTVGSDRQ